MKYTFVITTTISVSVDVEADSLEAAVQEAHDAPFQSFCHQCASGDRGEWCTSGELDGGDPADSELVDFCSDDDDADIERAKKLWSEP